MYKQGEQITSTKLKDIFQRMFKQLNDIDYTQIRAITCGQIVGSDTGAKEFEPLSNGADQFFSMPYQTLADLTAEESFLHKYVKEVNLLKGK